MCHETAILHTHTHKLITECFKKSFETPFKQAKDKLVPDNNPYLDQIITPERAKLGPDTNFTIYMYVCMYVCIYVYIYML